MFAAWRAALVKLMHNHASLRGLRTTSGFDELFEPWLDPLARIGYGADGIVAKWGADVELLAAAALDAAGSTGAWGQRHRLSPICAGSAPAMLAAEADIRARTRLSGDIDCVLATSSTPGLSDDCWRGPVARYVWDIADRSRSRWVVPFGSAGQPGHPHFDDQLPLWTSGRLIPVHTDWRRLGHDPAEDAVYKETHAALGRLSLTGLDPAADAEHVHRWVTRRGNQFWGMATHTLEEVRTIYTVVDGLATHQAYLIRLDDVPVGIFQLYDPRHDPLGERYAVERGDVGMHVLVSPDSRPPRGLVDALVALLARFVFLDPGARRIVAETDVRNAFALRRLRISGYTFGDQITLAGKQAQLAFLTRSAFAR
jgi:penicillin amidase